MSRSKTFLRRNPVTLLLIVIVWALWILGASDGLLDDLSVHTAGGAFMLTLLALAVDIPAERTLGWKRFLAVGVASQLIVVPLSLVIAKGIEIAGLNRWGDDLLRSTRMTLIAFIIGTAGFASARLPRLWRRRVRLVILVLPATMALYSGTLPDVIGVTAAVLSIAAGAWWAKETRGAGASASEKRVLTALVVGIVALGPLFVALNPGAEGPFSPVTQLMWSGGASDALTAGLCHSLPGSQECQDALSWSRVYGLGPAVADLIPLLIQLVLCYGLWKGRLAAWWGSLLVQFAAMAVLVTQLFDLDEDGVALYGINLAAVLVPWLGCACVLVWNRRVFSVRENSASVLRVLLRLLLAFVVVSAVWFVGAWLLRASFDDASFGSIAFEWPLRFFPPVVALLLPYALVPGTSAAWALYEWVGTVFWLYAAWQGWRIFARPADPSGDATHARAILESGSGDHLSFMTLWEGNRYFFNAAGDTYVAYRASRGVALSLGQPVGLDPEGCAAEFEAFARENSLRPAWYSVSEAFERPGFRRLEVAEEAVLPTDNVEFKGKKFQNVRTARNKAGKEGVTTMWTTWSELSLELQAAVIALSEEWVSEKSLPEMGFTLGSLPELRVPGTRLLLAVGSDGSLHGVTSWLPVHHSGEIAGYTLDVMRRSEHGFKGVIELLISEALLQAAAEGCEWISLSGAPLSGSSSEPGLLDALLSRVGEEMEPLYGFRTLAASKRKFQPTEHAWYLAYDDELALPAIAAAVVHAYVPLLSAADAARAVRAWLAARSEKLKQ
ncbi:hypothetical protein HMPREF2559_04030 [Corynebacterium sp. HMSC072G08]|uniref:bifunctional lysylphosphatidylglycerol flippase/synthetase MprF n=1 Tax=unclassified Corynebacterium TaxID=2624378 RepID=UPI00082EAD60|nr:MULTISPECIES: DUF2156 domain-containing protein [unclassified Corynebacterium]OFN40774.1 hypothetical protein HMPREF2559_04030 [Corynebacterium sp. HMSC072G08]